MNKEKIYIIIPVHNRKKTTLKCLDTLKKNGDLDKYYVIIVDDGSTDGTNEAIQELYPEVIILKGDGNLWWTGAIKKGMEYAYQQGAEYFIWLNDDCYPDQDTLPKIINLCKLNINWIVSAKCIDPETKKITYGGITTCKNYLEPIKESKLDLVECDALNGNLTCLPRSIISTIGYPDSKKFPHHLGDFVYTNLAKKQSYKLILNNQAIAFCKDDHNPISWTSPNSSLLKYWLGYWQPQSSYFWKTEYQAYLKIFGWKGVIYYFYQKHFKFFLIVIFIYPLPLQLKNQIKQLYQNCFNSKQINN